MRRGHEHRIQKLLLSGVSASVAEAVTFPLDAVKTRMQLNYSQGWQMKGGLLRTLHQIAWKEGPRSLYTGLFPAILRHVPYTGVRITLFEALKDIYNKKAGRDCESPALPLGPSLAFGLLSGGIGQLVAVPCDVVKIRMQADRIAFSSGKQPYLRYPTTWAAFMEVTSGGGVLGIRAAWRGSLPAISRAALVNLGELSTYDAAKRTLLSFHFVERSQSRGDEPVIVHVLSSICSGFVASAVSTPADVVKSRIMAIGTGASNPNTPYKNITDCVVRTVKEEGVRGLYKGFLPTWARLGPWQLVFWTSYEKLRSMGGLSGF